MSNTKMLQEKGKSGKVAVYARSAVDDQAHSACERQVQAARKVVDPAEQMTTYLDVARSGMDPDRLGLRRLLDDTRRENFDRLIVRDFSRLARDYILLTHILGELQAAGVEVVTIG